MAEFKLKAENEKLVSQNNLAAAEDLLKREILENEIECPRCHDSMILFSEFDNLYYSCESCDFCLFTFKKN